MSTNTTESYMAQVNFASENRCTEGHGNTCILALPILTNTF